MQRKIETTTTMQNVEFNVLMEKAFVLGAAIKRGNTAEIAAAKSDHDAYKAKYTNSDRMLLGGACGAVRR